MPRFEVEVTFRNEPRKKTLSVYGRDEEAACDKAAELVESWDGVEEVIETECLGEAD